MKQGSVAVPQSEIIGEESGYGLVDLLLVLTKHKKLVIAVPIAVAVISVAVTFVLPVTFKASTKLIPPQQSQSGTAALLSQLGGVAGAFAGGAGLKSQTDLYVGMLKSRTIADVLVDKFALMKVYETPSREVARRKLEANTVISSGKDGLIMIEVEHRDQAVVADLTNSYVKELFRLTQVLAVTEAAQRRMFFEQQLEAAKNNLATAELALGRTLELNGVVNVDSNSRAMMQTVAKIRAQISAKEIQLRSLEAFVTTRNPEFQRTQEELKSMRAELAKLESGRASSDGGLSQDRVAGLESVRLLRDFKYKQMLYELLAKQYEVARLDEAKDPSLIQVLDPAVTPEKKFRPKRALLVAASTLLALLVSIFSAFAIEASRRAALRPELFPKWTQLRLRLGIK